MIFRVTEKVGSCYFKYVLNRFEYLQFGPSYFDRALVPTYVYEFPNFAKKYCDRLFLVQNFMDHAFATKT